VLLLDEPFGALHALTREAMREWLLGVREADRNTIMLVTHDVEEAVFLCDRVYVMSGRPGRIRAVVEVARAAARARDDRHSAVCDLTEQLLAPLREDAHAGLGDLILSYNSQTPTARALRHGPPRRSRGPRYRSRPVENSTARTTPEVAIARTPTRTADRRLRRQTSRSP
jgi:ABC-type multidrug transport system ATPase subunit